MKINRNQESRFSDRRKFVGNTLRLVSGAAVLSSTALVSGKSGHPGVAYTVQQVIDLILKEIPNAPYEKTVDTIKSGSPGQTVTGIVSTMFATIDVINQARKIGANFIIAHEPTFYNHTDDRNYVKQNETLKKKLELLERLQITVWRCHDYCHSLKPEPMRYGIAKKAGWIGYLKADERTLRIPVLTLDKLVVHLKSTLWITQVKVIGDLQQPCERIALMPGASGGQSHLNMVEAEKPDVLVVGELHEWETAEYIRDGKLFGSKTALIILGHSVSEEPGMEYFAEWLAPRVGGVKVTHIASGDPFLWL